MLKNEQLLIGKGERECAIIPSVANRHGLICGATGTGKTITLKVMAESFSDLGVPVFLADIKGDLSGTVKRGERTDAIDNRLSSIGIDPESFEYKGYPVRFFDVFGDEGHPVRTTVSEMGPTLLSRLLGLSPAQSGVLAIVFRYADDLGWKLIDLKDLRAMVSYCTEHAAELLNDYGNISKQSAGAIQRALLQLEDCGGTRFFGEPAISLRDWMSIAEDGRGYINILACDKLYRSPLLYSTFMLWLLTELFEELPEIGDPEKPELVFFFDEAHLLFRDAPKALTDNIEQVVKLIRSKGVGVYFITQQPSDIPDKVLAQLGNKVQHALRAYTPTELKGVKAAAASFRANPDFDTEAAILELGTGEALISFLDRKGRPETVEKAIVLPPQSLMGPIDYERREAEIMADDLYGKYEEARDDESAYEIIKAKEETQKAESESEKAEDKKEKTSSGKTTQKKTTKTTRKNTAASKVTNSLLNTVGRELGKSIARGILGLIKR